MDSTTDTKLATSRIATIKPLGKRRVWDLSVADDHSYVAHGFVNHNSADPNLQNIPNPAKDKFKLRAAFVPSPGRTLLVADYEQVEMRLMASFANDAKMLEAFANGIDVHCLTAAEMYGIPYDELIAAKKADKMVKKGTRPEPLTEREEDLILKRTCVKSTGFGIIYGIQGPHLAANLTEDTGVYVSPKEGIGLIRRWFSIFPGVERYIQSINRRLRTDGYVQTITGRYRRFGDLTCMSKWDAARAERQGGNAIVQGTSSDVTKKAMLNIDEDQQLKDLGVRQLMQVHDELVLECPDDPEVVAFVEQRVKMHMESPYQDRLSITLPAEIGHGKSWVAAK